MYRTYIGEKEAQDLISRLDKAVNFIKDCVLPAYPIMSDPNSYRDVSKEQEGKGDKESLKNQVSTAYLSHSINKVLLMNNDLFSNSEFVHKKYLDIQKQIEDLLQSLTLEAIEKIMDTTELCNVSTMIQEGQEQLMIKSKKVKIDQYLIDVSNSLLALNILLSSL
ncbi:MAG: hypothetical protein WA432_01515 [Candidatus Babeliaceae bacterium]